MPRLESDVFEKGFMYPSLNIITQIQLAEPPLLMPRRNVYE